MWLDYSNLSLGLLGVLFRVHNPKAKARRVVRYYHVTVVKKFLQYRFTQCVKESPKGCELCALIGKRLRAPRVLYLNVLRQIGKDVADIVPNKAGEIVAAYIPSVHVYARTPVD